MVTPEHSAAGRALLGWSQKYLADLINVSCQTIVDFERGVRLPRERNLKAMLEEFNKYVDFSVTDHGEPIAILKNSIWKLTPVDLDSQNWQASTYRGVVYIRAPSERRARQIATLAFGIAVKMISGKDVASNPWGRIIGEVNCERVLDDKFPASGPEAILSPSDYDHEWRR